MSLNNSDFGYGIGDFNPDDYTQTKTEQQDQDYQAYLNAKNLQFNERYYTLEEMGDAITRAFEGEDENGGRRTYSEGERQEYLEQLESFKRTRSLFDPPSRTNPTLSWSLKNADNQMYRDYVSASLGNISYEQAQERYLENLNRIAKEHNMTSQEVLGWQAEHADGPVNGLAGIMRDMGDVVQKGGIAAGIIAGTGAVVGGTVGFFTNPNRWAGATSGALVGAKSAIAIAGKYILPATVFEDTLVKESGAFIANYVQTHPNMTRADEDKMKRAALCVGIANAGIEMGVAAMVLPYAGRLAMQIPGVGKIAGGAVRAAEKTGYKALQKYLSTKPGQRALLDAGAMLGIEVTTEVVQEINNMLGELALGEMSTPDEIMQRLSDTALATSKSMSILVGTGFAGSYIARKSAYQRGIDNLNTQIDQLNLQQTPAAATSVRARIVSEETGPNVSEYQGRTNEELNSERAQIQVQQTELDNNIRSLEIQLENARELNLTDEQKTALQSQLNQAREQKSTIDNQQTAINMEQRARQVEQTIDTQLERTNTELENVNTRIDETTSQLEQKQAELQSLESSETSSPKRSVGTVRRQIAKLQKDLTDYNRQLNALETHQENLIEDKAAVGSRTNLENLFTKHEQGAFEFKQPAKRTTTGRTTTTARTKAPREQTVGTYNSQIQQALREGNVQRAESLNRQVRQSIRKKVNDYVQGVREGINRQITETRNIRKELSAVLRTAGIRRDELGQFDALLKKIVTTTDLINRVDELDARVEAVLEARAKKQMLDIVNKLRKRAKPLKGSTPRGKYTADIQNKLNFLFSLTKRNAIQAGFDIADLENRYGNNQFSELQENEKASMLIDQNNEQIENNKTRIAELEQQRKEAPAKWQGKNKQREDTIKTNNIEEAVDSIKVDNFSSLQEAKRNKTGGPRVIDAINQITRALNAINMGFVFKDLKIEIKNSIFDKNVKGIQGRYNIPKKTLSVTKSAINSIAHEVGHYLDNKLASLFTENPNTSFTRMRTNITSPRLRRTMQKLNTLIHMEQARLNKSPEFRKLSKEDKEYLTRPSEIFARLFQAMVNKINNIDLATELELIDEVTDTVPQSSLNSFESILNDLADYKEYGQEIDMLQNQNRELAAENSDIRDNEASINKLARDKGLPENVQELIYMIDLASDLRNKTSNQIANFIKYVSDLMDRGIDENKRKQEEKRERIRKNTEDAINAFDKVTPNRKKSRLRLYPFFTFWNGVVADIYTAINLLCGKEIADRYNWYGHEVQKQAWIYNKKQGFMRAASEIFGLDKNKFKGLLGLGWINQQMLKDTIIVTENIDGNQVDSRYNRANILYIWMQHQNDLGRSRNEAVFDPDTLEYMFSRLTDEDKQLGRLLIKSFDNYDLINKKFREDRGIDLPKRENYVPFVSETQAFDVMSFLDNGYGYRIGMPSFTKNVIESSKVRMKKVNPISLLMQHLEDVGHYVFLNDIANEMNQVFSNPVFQRKVSFAYGEFNLKLFNSNLRGAMFEPRARENNLITKFFDFLVNSHVVTALAFKPSVAIKQWMGLINYAENVPTLYFAKYMGEFMLNPKKGIDFIMSDDYVRARFGAGLNAEEFAHAIETSSYNVSKNFVDLFTLNTRLGDLGAVIMGGYPMVKYLMNEKGMTKEQAFNEFRIATAMTQQFNATSSLSLIQRAAKGNPFARMVLAFTNTPYQYTRKTVNTIYQAYRGEISKRQAAKQILIYQILNPILYNMATSLSPISYAIAHAYGDEDAKEEALKEMLVNDIMGGIFIGNSDLLNISLSEMAWRSITGQKQYPTDEYPMLDEVKKSIVLSGDLLRASLRQVMGEEDAFDDLKLEDYLEGIESGVNLAKIPTKYPKDVWSAFHDDIFRVGSDGQWQPRPVSAAIKLGGWGSRKAEHVTGDSGL